jgi:hypothetical protein
MRRHISVNAVVSSGRLPRRLQIGFAASLVLCCMVCSGVLRPVHSQTFTEVEASADVPVIDFPYEKPTRWEEFVEAGPTALSLPVDSMGNLVGWFTRSSHDHVETELDEVPRGLKQIPSRPPLLLEWNEEFLAPGDLNEGIELPSGAIWRPSLWVFGQFRSAAQYFDGGGSEPVAEWANRLDLFGQVNLSGTERILVGIRPLDEESGDTRNFSGYDFREGWTDGWNSNFQTLFFEGDLGEIFPRLDPDDSRALDYGFSIGRMPLLAQQGLLINEDMIDAVTLTRNTLNGAGNLNLRMTGVYAQRGINRNSVTGLGNDFDPESRMVALLTESDFATRTINMDVAYVYGSNQFGNLFAFGLSSISRHHGFHNTYNTSLQVLASIPEGPSTSYAGQGALLFAQTSWTPHHTEDLVYLNSFWAVEQFTSPSRGPTMGGPLGQTGILFAGQGLGRAAAPLAVQTDNVAGASLGYQMFFDHTRQQVIWEVGGLKETEGPSRGAIGTGFRYQRAAGQHAIFVVDGFVGKQEHVAVSQGARTELLLKF